MTALTTCSVNSTNTGKTMKADVLQRSDKSLRVAIQGTTIILTLTRSDMGRPYVGNKAGMEFTSFG